MLAEQYAKDQQSLELLGYLLEYSAEAFFHLDSQLRILALNHQAELLCQKPRAELSGKALWEIFPALSHSELSPRLHEVLREHTTQEYTLFSHEFNGWFSLRLCPTRRGLLLFVEEVTRLKPTEVEREHSTSLSQAILDSTSIMMVVLDADGKISATNEAWRRHAQETCPTVEQRIRTDIGVDYLDVCQRAGRDGDKEALQALVGIQAVLQGTQPFFTQEYACFSLTQQRWYIMSVTPLGRSKGVVIAHIDITERKLFDQQKDTFIGMAGHELRTPLTALKGLVQLNKRRAAKHGSESQKHLFSDMEIQIERLTKLVTDLFDLSKMQAGLTDYVEEIIDVDAFIHEIVRITQQTNPSYVLRIHGSPSHAVIFGDYSRLSQVFTNLLGNAIKYSPQSKTVDIYVETTPDMVHVKIQDYGIGIPGEHLGHIFKRFYRSYSSRHTRSSGLGLGLYIAYEIVRHHQGTILVDSEEGKGSIFTVILPLYKPGSSSVGSA